MPIRVGKHGMILNRPQPTPRHGWFETTIIGVLGLVIVAGVCAILYMVGLALYKMWPWTPLVPVTLILCYLVGKLMIRFLDQWAM